MFKLLKIFLVIVIGLIGCRTTPSRQERIALEQFRQDDSRRRLELWPVAFRELVIPTRFGSTYGIASGPEDGPVILLVHAMGFNALTWAPNIDALTRSHRVIALDTIGDQGKSVARRDYPKNGQEYAAWMADIIDSLKSEKVTIIGCSMGGWISLNTAIYYQEKVSSIVLISPAAGIPVETTWMKYLNNIIFTSSKEKHRIATRFLLGNGSAFRDWEDYMVQVVSDINGVKIGIPKDLDEESLVKLTIPILLLVGEEEIIYKNKEDILIRTKDLLPQAKTKYIPRAGHMGHYDNPEFVNLEIIEFLATIDY